MQPVIHVVDDDSSFRSSIARLLKSAGYEVLAYESADQILQMAQDSRCGCIIMDMKMPKLNGLEVQERLASREFAMPIIFLTGQGSIEQSVSAMKAGAVDFLTKPVQKPKLLAAIERALSHDRRLKEHKALAAECQARYATLTPREKQVYEKVVQGRMNKQTAYMLGTSERTIKAHRQKIMHKLRVSSITELVTFSERFIALSSDSTFQIPRLQKSTAHSGLDSGSNAFRQNVGL